MARCTHVQWIELDGLDTSWSLIDPYRWDRLCREFQSPDEQFPLLVLFIGRQIKMEALRAMFHQNNVSRRVQHGLANLYTDNLTIRDKYPVLIADCTPTARCTNQIGRWNLCHQSIERSLCTEGGILLREATDLVIGNLFRPFCHVIVLFTADFGGAEASLSIVEGLLTSSPDHAGTSVQQGPELLVVIDPDEVPDLLLALSSTASFKHSFSNITVLRQARPAPTGFLAVRSHVATLLDVSCEQRRRDCMLFSARHLRCIFKHAVEDFCKKPHRSIDLFAAYRHPASIAALPSLDQTVEKLANMGLPIGTAYEVLAASCTVLAFPVNHHSECSDRETVRC